MKRIKYYEKKLAEKEEEYHKMLAIVATIKNSAEWKEREIWIGNSECYTIKKENLDVVYKFFKEEKLHKAYKEFKQTEKEYLEFLKKEI